MTRALFIESLIGNIKEKYFFEKKLGSGGYGAVYLAKNKGTGKLVISHWCNVLLKLYEECVKGRIKQSPQNYDNRGNPDFFPTRPDVPNVCIN